MMDSSEVIEFVGSINKVIWSKDSFKIATMRVSEIKQGAPHYSGGDLIFKGEMNMMPQNEYIIRGRYVEHPKYGGQYDFLFAKLKDPLEKMTAQQFGRFLIGLSPKCTEILKMYPDPRQIFEDHNIPALVKVKGIGEATAVRLLEKYDNQRDLSPAIIAYSKYGFSVRATKAAVRQFRSVEEAIDVLKKNPYKLMQVPGMGFKSIDEKARKHGIADNDPRRVIAFLVDYFEKQALDGSSWTTVNALKKYLRQNIFDCDLEATFNKINNSDYFIVFKRGEHKCVALRKYFELEAKVANDLLMLKYSNHLRAVDNQDQIVKEIEARQGWRYSDEQRKAIDYILDRSVSLLRGPGGVGKTTVLKALIEIFQRNGLSVATCALAGKAADNLTQVTGLQGLTIHKLLGLNQFQTVPVTLAYDVVILDETSMVNLELFAKLLAAMPKDARLIMVGDSAQLDSIGIGVMQGMIDSGVIPVMTLNKIHRQAQKSAIITHSLAFRSGRLPQGLSARSSWHLLGERKDLGYVLEEDEDKILADTCKVFAYSLKKFSIKDIQIITPTTINCGKLNSAAQRIANPEKGQPHYELYPGKSYGYVLREGDRVINTANNYQTVSADNPDRVLPIFNGNTGTIEKIDIEATKTGRKSVEITIDFDGVGRVLLTKDSEFVNIQLGYAITVHKSQGSTIPCVIVALPFHYMLNTRELIYTAITRASQMSYLISSMKTLRSTVRKTAAVVSHTNLADFLKKKDKQYAIS